MLFIPIINHMSSTYQSIGRCRHHKGIKPGPLDEQDLQKCSGNLYCWSYHAGPVLGAFRSYLIGRKASRQSCIEVSSEVAAHQWYQDLLSSRRTALVETGLFRCRFNLAITLVAVVRCFLPAIRFNARRSQPVSMKVRPELLRLLEGFPCFMNSVGSAVLKIEVSCRTSFKNLPFFKLSYIKYFNLNLK